MDQGARVYDLSAFQIGFIPMVGWALMAVMFGCLGSWKAIAASLFESQFFVQGGGSVGFKRLRFVTPSFWW